MKRGGLALIRLYQRFVSPALPNTCRYEPSCSQYAYEAIERHGVGRGVALAARRLGRCTPLHRGGYDPVPSREDAPPAEGEPSTLATPVARETLSS